MKKIRFFPLIIMICLVFSVTAPSAWATDTPDFQAAAYVLVDLSSGQVLASKDMNKARAPASLTKVMTALLTLEAIEKGEASMDDMVVAQADARQGMNSSSSTSGIYPGMELSLRELLYCAMLQSANEACNIIGRYLAGSISAFVDRMNEKAEEIGCTNTHFMNPNGLSTTDHYTTAYDLYLITKAAMEYPDFMEICNTLSYRPENPQVNSGYTIYNTNALLLPDGYQGRNYYYEYAAGVKTGFTRAAGYCLISTASKDGLDLLVVVLGCLGPLTGANENRNFSVSKSIYEWAYDSFGYQTLLSAGDTVFTANVANAQGGAQAVLYAAEDVVRLLPTDLGEGVVSTEVTLFEESLSAPLAAGAVLGEVSILIDGEETARVELINTADIGLQRAEVYRSQQTEDLTGLLILGEGSAAILFLAGYLILTGRYGSLRRQQRKQRKLAAKRQA